MWQWGSVTCVYGVAAAGIRRRKAAVVFVIKEPCDGILLELIMDDRRKCVYILVYHS